MKQFALKQLPVKRAALVATLPLLLAACGDGAGGNGAGGDAGEGAMAPEAAPTGPPELVPDDLGALPTGPRIVGPQGPEVASQLAVGGRPIADIVSHVACPPPEQGLTTPAEPADTCIPADQGPRALYTYVHRVTPTGIAGDDGAAPLSFRTLQGAPGFAGTIGFDHAQAQAALGEGYAISVQQQGGALVWQIESGDGWSDGEEITFFWQSTLPPAGPAQAYAIETLVGDATGTGPFPTAPAITSEVE